MPNVFRVGEVYLPLDSKVADCDRRATGDAGALSVGGGGGGGGDAAPTLLPWFRETSSSVFKSLSCQYGSVSVTTSKALPSGLQQLTNDSNTAQLYTHHKALQERTSNKSEHKFHR